VIASLNGVSSGGWLEYARLMEEAGADAIELNIYSIATNPAVSGAEVEQGYIDLVRQLKALAHSAGGETLAVFQRACEYGSPAG